MATTDNTELTISLRADLAHTIRAYAEEEGKTPEEFIVAALREIRKDRAIKELRDIQSYWSKKAEDLGIQTEEELLRYLES